MTKTKKYIFTFLSAVLSSLPFTFPNLFLLTLVSPSVFFFFLLKEERLKSSFFLSLVFSATYYLGVHYYFIALYPLDFAGLSNALSLIVVFLGWVGISLFQGLELALFLTLFKKLDKKRGTLSSVLLASLFTLAEAFQALGTLGFPWGGVYITQYKFLPFIQSASLFGPLFITFLVIFANALLSQFYHYRRKHTLVVFVLILLSNTAFGMIHLNVSSPVKDTLDVTLVQPTILSGEKWYGTSSFDTLLSLSESAPDAELIVWPETAVNSNLLENETKCERIGELISKKDAMLITGAFYEEGENTYNSAMLFYNTGVQLYHKRHLVPFGEYLPARGLIETFLPFLADINMLSSDLTSGGEASVFNTPFGNIGALVCFDSIFTNLAVDSTREGAQLLCIITNDSWYKTSTALSHHNAQAVFRAVENGRFVVRCANSGISSFIDSRGRVLASSLPNERLTLTENVSLIDGETLYTKTGNVFPLFALVFVIAYAFKKKAR